MSGSGRPALLMGMEYVTAPPTSKKFGPPGELSAASASSGAWDSSRVAAAAGPVARAPIAAAPATPAAERLMNVRRVSSDIPPSPFVSGCPRTNRVRTPGAAGLQSGEEKRTFADRALLRYDRNSP